MRHARSSVGGACEHSGAGGARSPARRRKRKALTSVPHGMIATTASKKPKLRGRFHELGFYAALGLGAALSLTAEPGRARVAAAVFSTCLAGCFGASALYHRPTWTPTIRAWLARLDHAGIYLLIAGTYTPFGLIVMSTEWAVPVLSLVWAGAFAAILVKLFWVRAPKWLSAALAAAGCQYAAIAFFVLPRA